MPVRRNKDPTAAYAETDHPTRELFLESPGSFSGPELYFKVKIYRMVVWCLAHKPAPQTNKT